MEDYKLVFKGPSRAEIIVYEKSVVGYVSYMQAVICILIRTVSSSEGARQKSSLAFPGSPD
ncbi:MAG: hypothetical protein ACLUD2_14405 [Clostridium sp.]